MTRPAAAGPALGPLAPKIPLAGLPGLVPAGFDPIAQQMMHPAPQALGPASPHFQASDFQSNEPPHLVQRWLGHASLRTTYIYGDVMGSEERAFAARMWAKGNRTHP